MKSVKRANTGPELAVRSLLHRAGFRFRKNVRSLPGTPDVVLPRYRTVIYVHGCFWHQHPGCKRATVPASNRAYWDAKLESNSIRDRKKSEQLRQLGWRVIIVWECELADPARLRDRLVADIGKI